MRFDAEFLPALAASQQICKHWAVMGTKKTPVYPMPSRHSQFRDGCGSLCAKVHTAKDAGRGAGEPSTWGRTDTQNHVTFPESFDGISITGFPHCQNSVIFPGEKLLRYKMFFHSLQDWTLSSQEVMSMGAL